MKDTMSKRNVAKFHKLLEQEVPLKKISQYLGVSMQALKEFTPAKVQAAKERAKAREAELQASADAAKEAGVVLASAAKEAAKPVKKVTKKVTAKKD